MDKKQKIRLAIELRDEFGGQGSGNFGHQGRPGEVGGSGEGGMLERDSPSGHELKAVKFKSDYGEISVEGSSGTEAKHTVRLNGEYVGYVRVPSMGTHNEYAAYDIDGKFVGNVGEMRNQKDMERAIALIRRKK